MTLLLVTSALAADLTFDDAVRLALTDGAAAQIVAAEAAGARASGRGDAAYAGNPEVSLERRPGEATVLLSIPVEFGALARAGAATDAADAADIRQNAGRAAVASAAGAAYLDAVRTRELARIAGDAQALAGRLRATGDARFAAGEVPSSEHALLLAEAAHALDAALSLQRDAAVANRLLGVLVGMPPGQAPGVSGWPDLAVPQAIDADRLPAVLAADLDARAALKRRHAAELSLIPSLAVSGGWVVRGQTGPAYGAALAIPLFAPGASRVQAARAVESERDADADLARLDASAGLADALAELDIAAQIAAAWSIPDLDGALAAAGRRYEAGESSLVAYVSERDLALAALESGVDARWRLQRARLALWELAGETPVEDPR